MDIKTPYIWKNWNFIKWDDCVVQHVNHSLHYGSGVFEGIRFYPTSQGPKIFRLKEHILRLFYSAKTMNLSINFSEEEIMQACIDAVKKSNVESGYIRPIIYHKSGNMWLKAENDIEAVVSVWAWGKYLSDNPISVKIPKLRRMAPQTADMKAKVCGYYSNNILASQEIKSEWYDEGLLLDINNNVAEGPWENIFFIKWKDLYTPELWAILPWITRNTIIKILKEKFSINVIEKKILESDIPEFDEAFFVGTAAEVTLIGSITLEGGKKVELESNFSRKIKKLYEEIVTWEVKEYNGWLY